MGWINRLFKTLIKLNQHASCSETLENNLFQKFITASKRSCRKVKFSQVSDHRKRGSGTVPPGPYPLQGCTPPSMYDWQAGGRHPTGMLSCFCEHAHDVSWNHERFLNSFRSHIQQFSKLWLVLNLHRMLLSQYLFIVCVHLKKNIFTKKWEKEKFGLLLWPHWQL